MRSEHGGNPKASWPKVVVRKWLSSKGGTDETRSEETTTMQQRRKSCSDTDCATFVKRDRPVGRVPWSVGGNLNHSQFTAEDNLRMFVGTWNVGGKAPHGGLHLREWLGTPAPADIYVLGFQEIVPLNAGNVLGSEDKGPATKWLSLIRQALNLPRRCSTFSGPPAEKPRVSFSDLLSLEGMMAESEEEPGRGWWTRGEDSDDPGETGTSPNSSEDAIPDLLIPAVYPRGCSGEYCLVASKQMVGVFLCVWIRSDLARHVAGLRASCVGRGIMGYMGNKGSISISMTLRGTTFCFVCTHLASGEKEGDEIRRNADVVEILRRTRFPRPRRSSWPGTILEHDKVIWLGDLNYRLVSGRCDTQELLQKNDWQALLEKDQLRREQNAGRVFAGWEEGRIDFPPTYKYMANSDDYAMQTASSKEKRRIPAWCDRILWRGKGMQQVCYVRGESRFSDHRPVYAIFNVQVDKEDRVETASSSSRWPVAAGNTGVNIAGNATSCARVQAEEMFVITRTQSCLGASRF